MTEDRPIRRPPPPFLPMEVQEIGFRTPHLARITFYGQALAALEVTEPAASVRLLIPSPGSQQLEIPEWEGNEFLLADGSRPIIRTLTPVRADPHARELDLDIVLHEGGALAAWVGRAGGGSPAAVSGPGRGYTIDDGATAYVLAGDETAIPAIEQLIAAIPAGIPILGLIEVRGADAEVKLAGRSGLVVRWVPAAAGGRPGSRLVDEVRMTDLPPGAKIWCAGEAAAMHRIRKHLFDERGLARSDATVRGYWKHGR